MPTRTQVPPLDLSARPPPSTPQAASAHTRSTDSSLYLFFTYIFTLISAPRYSPCDLDLRSCVSPGTSSAPLDPDRVCTDRLHEPHHVLP